MASPFCTFATVKKHIDFIADYVTYKIMDAWSHTVKMFHLLHINKY